jgi:hypothetical protein
MIKEIPEYGLKYLMQIPKAGSVVENLVSTDSCRGTNRLILYVCVSWPRHGGLGKS